MQAVPLDQDQELVPVPNLLEEKAPIMHPTNVQRALRARHPLDELRIRSVVYRVCTPPMSANDIETIWADYSWQSYGEHWTTVDDDELVNFESWIKR